MCSHKISFTFVKVGFLHRFIAMSDLTVVNTLACARSQLSDAIARLWGERERESRSLESKISTMWCYCQILWNQSKSLRNYSAIGDHETLVAERQLAPVKLLSTWNWFFFWMLWSLKHIFSIVKMNVFWGGLSYSSAEKASLASTTASAVMSVLLCTGCKPAATSKAFPK